MNLCPGASGLSLARACLMCLLLPSTAWAEKQSPVERMRPARLKAAHEDVMRIQRSRQILPPVPGLNDYRVILHAHAEDSSHTGGTRPEMLRRSEAGRSQRHPADRPLPPAQRLRHPELAGPARRRTLHPRLRGPRVPALSEPLHHGTDEGPDSPVHHRRASRWGPDLPLAHRGTPRSLDGRPRWDGDLQSPCRRQEGQGRVAGDLAQADLPAVHSRSSKNRSRLSRRTLRVPRWNTRPTTWPSGIARPRPAG